MTVNFFSKETIMGLNTELCSLIEFILKYDSKNRNTTEKKSSWNENFRATENKGTKPLDIKVVFSQNPGKINARATVGNDVLGDRDPRSSSKSHFSHYSKLRSELSTLYKPSLKQEEKCTRMTPYPVPLCRKSPSNDNSSGERKRFEAGRNIRSFCSVSDHQKSNPTSIRSFNKKSTNNNDIDMHGRYREDHIQELIGKIYNEQQTLEELMRCKTQSHFKPCNLRCHSTEVLNQPLLVASFPPRFLRKYVCSAIAKPDKCPNNPDLFEVPEGGDCKEELFDAFHVPYFKEKLGVAKQLDELFNTQRSNSINFI